MTQIRSKRSVPSTDVTEEFVPSADQLVAHNERFSGSFEDGDLAVAPAMKLAVVACMDSRMDIFKILGLANGEAHILRNAGGVITDDVIRSLCLSQRFLGTQEIVLLHHTDCGLQKVSEDEFKADLEAELGIKPRWSLEPFTDPYGDTRQSMQRLIVTPFVDASYLRGFVYDVTDGRLREVSQAE